MRDRSLFFNVMKRKGPISSRTRIRMGSPRRRRAFIQHLYQNPWVNESSTTELTNYNNRTLRSRPGRRVQCPSVSTDKFDEMDRQDKKAVEKTARRSSGLKETLSESGKQRRRKAASVRRVSRSLIHLVSFKPKTYRNNREAKQRTGKESKLQRKPGSSKRCRSVRYRSRSRSGRKSKTTPRLRSRRRGSNALRRRGRVVRGRPNQKATRLRYKCVARPRLRRPAKSRGITTKSHRRRRTARGAGNKPRRRTRRRRKRRSSSCSSSCSDSEEMSDRRRVFYDEDFFHKEQEQILNEPNKVTYYDNADKDIDKVKEDPLDNVCRSLVKNLDGVPADDRTEEKKKTDVKPNNNKDKKSAEAERGKKTEKMAVHSRKRKRKQRKGRASKRKQPERRQSPRSYPAYQIMDDTRKRVRRYAKKVGNGQHSDEQYKDHGEPPKHNGSKQHHRLALKQMRHRSQMANRKLRKVRQTRQKGSSLVKNRRKTRSRRKIGVSRRYRRPQDRNNNVTSKTSTSQMKMWLRCFGRLRRVRDLSRELITISFF